MSPEQMEACHPEFKQSVKDLDGRSDIYSLGISLWQLLFGTRPYPNQTTEMGLLRAMTDLIETRKQEIKITAAHRTIAPGLVEILKKCITPRPGDRIATGTALARELSICHEPGAYAMVHPKSAGLIDRLRRNALPILIVAAIVPNIMAGLFNYYYNYNEIIVGLPAIAQKTFWDIQLVINLLAFPLGLGWFLYLAHPILKSIKQSVATDEESGTKQLRSRCLKLGHYGALINIALWCLAGIAYPMALHFSTGTLSAPDYTHFFGSLLLCGMITSVYPFFLITAFCIKAAYPRFLPGVSKTEHERRLIAKIEKRTYAYICLAALVPLLAVLALVLIDSKARVTLLILSAASLCGLGLIFALFRFIQIDIKTLRNILESFDAAGTAKF